MFYFPSLLGENGVNDRFDNALGFDDNFPKSLTIEVLSSQSKASVVVDGATVSSLLVCLSTYLRQI